VRDLILGPECFPRILLKGDWTYGVLPDFERDFEGRSGAVGRLRFAFDPMRFISVRRRSLFVIHDLRKRLSAGQASFARPSDAFVALTKLYCEIAEDQLDAVAEKLGEIEDHVLAGRENPDRLELAPLRRDLSRRHREISGLRTAYNRAASRQLQSQAHPFAPHLPLLAQQTEDVEREIASLQERARLIHEEIDTRTASATNRTLQALTIISALLMPPTLVVGAFGMNFKGMPFANDPQGFALALVLCVLVGVAFYAVLIRMRVLK
jgi:zinc transporter